MNPLGVLIVLLVVLGVMFVFGIWFSRHHHEQITGSIASLHNKVDAVRATVNQIKKV